MRYWAFLICLLWSTALWAGNTTTLGMFGTVSAGPTTETFEGTGTPSGWAVVSGSPDFDYTTSPLDDAQSLAIPTSSDRAGWAVDASDTLYVTCHAEYPTLPTLTSSVFQIYEATNTTLLGTVSVRTNGNIQAQAAGGTADNAAPAMVAATPIYLKMKQVKGTGADASTTAYISSDGLNWTLNYASTNGTTTAQPGYLRIISSDQLLKVDNCKFSSSDITDAR